MYCCTFCYHCYITRLKLKENFCRFEVKKAESCVMKYREMHTIVSTSCYPHHKKTWRWWWWRLEKVLKMFRLMTWRDDEMSDVITMALLTEISIKWSQDSLEACSWIWKTDKKCLKWISSKQTRWNDFFCTTTTIWQWHHEQHFVYKTKQQAKIAMFFFQCGFWFLHGFFCWLWYTRW